MPANTDERVGLQEIVESIDGLLIGDKEFINQDLKEKLLKK